MDAMHTNYLLFLEAPSSSNCSPFLLSVPPLLCLPSSPQDQADLGHPVGQHRSTEVSQE